MKFTALFLVPLALVLAVVLLFGVRWDNDEDDNDSWGVC